MASGHGALTWETGQIDNSNNDDDDDDNNNNNSRFTLPNIA